MGPGPQGEGLYGTWRTTPARTQLEVAPLGTGERRSRESPRACLVGLKSSRPPDPKRPARPRSSSCLDSLRANARRLQPRRAAREGRRPLDSRQGRETARRQTSARGRLDPPRRRRRGSVRAGLRERSSLIRRLLQGHCRSATRPPSGHGPPHLRPNRERFARGRRGGRGRRRKRAACPVTALSVADRIDDALGPRQHTVGSIAEPLGVGEQGVERLYGPRDPRRQAASVACAEAKTRTMCRPRPSVSPTSRRALVSMRAPLTNVPFRDLMSVT